jgi:hypothetical protein
MATSIRANLIAFGAGFTVHDLQVIGLIGRQRQPGFIALDAFWRPLSFSVSDSSDLRPVLTITPALWVPFPAAMASFDQPTLPSLVSVEFQPLLMPLWTLRMLLFHGVSKLTLPPPLTVRSWRLLKALRRWR